MKYTNLGVDHGTRETATDTAEGWLYRAAVLDLFSRRVGDGRSCRGILAEAAWQMVAAQSRPVDSLLHHFERGSPY